MYGNLCKVVAVALVLFLVSAIGAWRPEATWCMRGLDESAHNATAFGLQFDPNGVALGLKLDAITFGLQFDPNGVALLGLETVPEVIAFGLQFDPNGAAWA